MNHNTKSLQAKTEKQGTKPTVIVVWEGENAKVTQYIARDGKRHYCAHWRYPGQEWIDGKVFDSRAEAIEWAEGMDVS